jgi:NAD-dependent DNA ligase
MDDLATTLTAVMGIGRETALTIAAYFHDFPTFYNADVKQLQEVKDVGPVLADRVHAHFHSTGGTPSPQSLPQLEKELAAQ